MAGSPPRVRGTEGDISGQCHLYGITPACAGNSSEDSSKSNHSKDHPRVCGEQSVIWCIATIWKGSPPRVRGTVHASLI